jgi:hypothetical protein
VNKPNISENELNPLMKMSDLKAAKYLSKIAQDFLFRPEAPDSSPEDKAVIVCNFINRVIKHIGKEQGISPGTLNATLAQIRKTSGPQKRKKTSFKYWYIDSAGNVFHWKGTGLPPKGFHELALQQRLEEYNVNRTHEPKLFNL